MEFGPNGPFPVLREILHLRNLHKFRLTPVSSEIYAVAKFMTSAKFMTLTLSLTLIYDPNPNPNPNPIPCEILDVEILDACADSPIVINFASGEFRATPGQVLTPVFLEWVIMAYDMI